MTVQDFIAKWEPHRKVGNLHEVLVDAFELIEALQAPFIDFAPFQGGPDEDDEQPNYDEY